MKIILHLLIIGLLFPFALKAQKDTLEVNSKIESVVVFPNGAQITRKAQKFIPAGKSHLIIKGLPLQTNLKTLQIQFPKGLELVSLTPQVDIGNNLLILNKSKKLREKIENIKTEISKQNSKLVVLKDKKEVLKKNNKIETGEKGLSLTQLQSIVDYYEKQITGIENSKIIIREKIKQQEKEIFDLKQQLHTNTTKKSLQTLNLILKVNTSKALKRHFSLTYTNPKAGWIPSYDFVVKSTFKPLEIKYKATVFQSTQEDWNNIKMTLSTSDLYRDKSIRKLTPWLFERGNSNHPLDKEKISYGSLNVKVIDSKYQEPISNAKVSIFHGSKLVHQCFTDNLGKFKVHPLLDNSIYTVKVESHGYQTNSKKMYSNGELNSVQLSKENHYAQVKAEIIESEYKEEFMADEMELKEIVPSIDNGLSVRGGRGGEVVYYVDGVKVNGNSYNQAKSTNTISLSALEHNDKIESDFTYSLKQKMTVLSNGEAHNFDLQTTKAVTDYEYIVVPELKKIANLQVLLPDWESLRLQDAPVHYYYENRLVNQADFVNENFQDTLALDFTEDNGIITRKKNIKLQESKKFFSGKIKEFRSIELEVKNNKNTPVQIKLQDVLPISEFEDIVIEIEEMTLEPNEKSDQGIYTWKFLLQPKAKKTITYKYSVRYPKKMLR
ncbi:MAG: mucoidy inhibitor MuiA family protein [Flavobacteriales bacterium]|jgi:hypothetical protein|nr:mucoidy inhibitor MuiA family protein [Flavobacteriales bacterium]